MTAGRLPITQDGPDVLLTVRVQPRASRTQLIIGGLQPSDPSAESITIRLTAPPVEGAANATCQAFLADLLGLPKSRIVIVRGKTARHKLLRIRDADAASVVDRLHSQKG
jgi:uncharacterized protein (TIGR00251 family)